MQGHETLIVVHSRHRHTVKLLFTDSIDNKQENKHLMF